MIIGIIIYILNFFTGKSKNQKNLEDIQEPLIKESENIFR